MESTSRWNLHHFIESVFPLWDTDIGCALSAHSELLQPELETAPHCAYPENLVDDTHVLASCVLLMNEVLS